MTSTGPGRLVAICGIDGSGKTTQQDELARWLVGRGIDVLKTQQPTDWYRNATPVKRYLDDGDDVLGMEGLALVAAADRQYHVRGTILPALAQGRWVVSNRYVYSTYAYFQARGLALAFLKTINPGVPRPAMTVLLDLTATASRDRVVRRDGAVKKFEERKLDFMEAVRRHFLEGQDESFLVIDALQPAEVIQAQIRERCIALGA